MGNIRQISTELRPLIDLKNSLSIFALLYRFSSNLLKELISGRNVLGLQMSKFRQISTELWPLIDVRNWFLLSVFGISIPIFFKILRVVLGLQMGAFYQIITELRPLIDVQNFE